MHRTDIINYLEDKLELDLIGKIHSSGRKIIKVEVNIISQDQYSDDGYNYIGSFDELIIKVETESKDGKNRKWEHYYI